MNLQLAIEITYDFRPSRFSLSGFSFWSAKLAGIKSIQSRWISYQYAPPDWIIIFLWIFTCVKCSSWTYRYKNIEETILVCIPKILMTQNTIKRLHSTLLIPLQVKIKYSTLLICLQVKIKYGFCYKAKVIIDIRMLCLSSRSGFPCNPIPHPPPPWN